jgi:hypothetical protein
LGEGMGEGLVVVAGWLLVSCFFLFFSLSPTSLGPVYLPY